jgi:hypothetical protein
MPRPALDTLVEDRLSPEAGGRFLDLRIDVMSCTCPKCQSFGAPAIAEHFLTAGGVWDRARKAYTGETARTSRRVLVQPAQYEAVRWFARWLHARQAGEHILGPDGTPCFTAGLVGGRRSGKTYLSPNLQVVYAVAFPFSINWVIIPDYPDMPEVIREVEAQLPVGWYSWRGEPWYTWTLANGGQLEIRSGHRPKDLKRGRCDTAVIHEAQNQDVAVFNTVAPAQADRGGLTIVVANPPDSPRGAWVEDFVERARAGKTDEVVFELDARKNPHVDHATLLSLAKKMDERTYRREIKGEFLPRTDVVMYGFSPSPLHGNVREVPPDTDDITESWTRRTLGRSYPRVVGCDFQLKPHMAGVGARVFRDPDDPTAGLLWFENVAIVEEAVEDDLIDELEAQEYDGASTAMIGDATGEWQNAERTKGGASFDAFRKRGWRMLYRPDPRRGKDGQPVKTNPPIMERLGVMNALWRSGDEHTGYIRRAFVAPRCVPLIRALRLWENKSGFPNRRSVHAHVGDAASYLAYRLFQQRIPRAKMEFRAAARHERGGWEEIR